MACTLDIRDTVWLDSKSFTQCHTPSSSVVSHPFACAETVLEKQAKDPHCFILLLFFGRNGTNHRSLFLSCGSVILSRRFKMYCILKTKYSTFSICLFHTFLNIKMIRSGLRPILWESPWLKHSACGCLWDNEAVNTPLEFYEEGGKRWPISTFSVA